METIYEEKMTDNTKSEFAGVRSKLMTPEEIRRTDFYLSKYEQLKAEQEEIQEELQWSSIEDAYKGDMDFTPSEKESMLDYGFVNVVLPNIEGQVAAMTNTKLGIQCKGKGQSDKKFARTANIIAQTIVNENKTRDKLKKSARRYLKFGWVILGCAWNKEMLNKFGLAEFRTPSPTKVFIDGKIKDLTEVQKAEYVIEEIGSVSLEWVRNTFDNGEDLAHAIQLGNTDPEFSAQSKDDDKDSFTLIHVWTRNNPEGNLQLLQLSKCGVLLEESESKEPYYKHVQNKYPYFPACQYEIEGQLIGFGDGKLLLPIQKILNNLYKEIIKAVRFAPRGKTYIDPDALVNPAEVEDTEQNVVIAKNPQQFIKDTNPANMNPVLLDLLQHLFTKIQETIRFSALMTGNGTGERMTATQAGIQQQQGVSGIDDKKADMSSAVKDMVEYAIGLSMEFWSAAKALRIAEDKEDFEWIDARELARVPVLIPASNDYASTFKELNPHAEEQTEMQLEYDEDETDEQGNPLYDEVDDGNGGKLQVKKTKRVGATKEIELDIEVTIGEGMPTNKMALYNMVISLAQLRIPDEAGVQRAMIEFKQARKMIEDILGFRLSDENASEQTQIQQAMMMIQQMQQQIQSMQGGGNVPPVNMDANIPGANMVGMMKGGASGVV